MQIDKLYLIAIVVFTQMASAAAAGLVYTDNNITRFRCTPQSPLQRPDTYRLTTGSPAVTVSFPLTHIFCGEFHGMKATGFHSEAAPQSNTQKSAERVNQTNWAIVYNASNQNYTAPKFSTFFCSSLTVKGLSNCISKWAARCYRYIMKNNYGGNCMHLIINIPSINNGIQVFYKRQRHQQVILTTAYPPAKNPNANCTTCLIPHPLNKCNLRQ